ncbi:MAG: permease-like cell division protein FtsX [Candidatus Zixiibacteriota bacterium]
MRISCLIKQAFCQTEKRFNSQLLLLLCIASAFLAFGGFLLITLNLRAAVQNLKGEVQIEVYLNDHITSPEFHSLLQKMRVFPEVEKVRYRSKREALTQMENYLGEDLLPGQDSSPLPASFLVSIREEHRRFEPVARVAFRVQKEEGVEEVVFGGTWLKKLDRVISVFLMIDLALGTCMALAIVMIVANLTRVTVRLRAESIRIMSLLGASSADISLPLLILGISLGGFGALLGILFLWAGYLTFTSQFLAIRFLPVHMVVGMVVWGMALGAGGSLIPTMRLLRARW